MERWKDESYLPDMPRWHFCSKTNKSVDYGYIDEWMDGKICHYVPIFQKLLEDISGAAGPLRSVLSPWKYWIHDVTTCTGTGIVTGVIHAKQNKKEKPKYRIN